MSNQLEAYSAFQGRWFRSLDTASPIGQSSSAMIAAGKVAAYCLIVWLEALLFHRTVTVRLVRISVMSDQLALGLSVAVFGCCLEERHLASSPTLKVPDDSVHLRR